MKGTPSRPESSDGSSLKLQHRAEPMFDDAFMNVIILYSINIIECLLEPFTRHLLWTRHGAQHLDYFIES